MYIGDEGQAGKHWKVLIKSKDFFDAYSKPSKMPFSRKKMFPHFVLNRMKEPKITNPLMHLLPDIKTFLVKKEKKKKKRERKSIFK